VALVGTSPSEFSSAISMLRCTGPFSQGLSLFGNSEFPNGPLFLVETGKRFLKDQRTTSYVRDYLTRFADQ
jgi:hypothetical protein